MASQNSVVLLSRLLSLKESSPFLLVLDLLAQSSHYIVQEFAHHNSSIVYLSFETVNRPKYCTEFIECVGQTPQQITAAVNAKISQVSAQKTLLIIDSLNYIDGDQLTGFITGLFLPKITILGVFHTMAPQPATINYPSSQHLLSYIASSIFEVEPQHLADEESVYNLLHKLQFPINTNLNSPVFKLTLTNRRKSGRSLIYRFIINTENHTYEVYNEPVDETVEEDESLLKDLTTFNLTTNNKQKLAREQVELPFMEAQRELGSAGGAIVYEFEKDDDYDEEDPYEDPF